MSVEIHTFPGGMRMELSLLTKYLEISKLHKSHLFLLLTISLSSCFSSSFKLFMVTLGYKVILSQVFFLTTPTYLPSNLSTEKFKLFETTNSLKAKLSSMSSEIKTPPFLRYFQIKG